MVYEAIRRLRFQFAGVRGVDVVVASGARRRLRFQFAGVRGVDVVVASGARRRLRFQFAGVRGVDVVVASGARRRVHHAVVHAGVPLTVRPVVGVVAVAESRKGNILFYDATATNTKLEI